MKLYQTCNCCYKKNYINVAAQTRQELVNRYGYHYRNYCGHCGYENFFDVNGIGAEVSTNHALASSALGGGIIGVVAGPVGIAIGLLGGLGVGSNIRQADRRRVEYFNSTFFY